MERRKGRIPSMSGMVAASMAALAVSAFDPSGAARAQSLDGLTEVDVELVLAVDVSLSMDVREQRLQREGYVRALADPDVHRAIERGLLGRVAITYIEWAGTSQQRTILDWSLVENADDALELSAALAEAPLARIRRTSISAAIDFAAAAIETNAYHGLRRVIDVSGDGANNQGEYVTTARDRALQQGIIINGLPFVPDPEGNLGLFDLPELDVYYEDCVIGGPGAFSLPVRDPESFAEAIRTKLILEISGVPPVRLELTNLAGEPRIPCDIGERQWDMFMGR
ncbi:MAG: DUF1194 domain-containing protein [Pseudomonadota bacterium]